MKKQFLRRALITILTAGSCVTWATAEPDDLNRCNVVWDSPSADCHGSMPIGNGDLAANVWVEPNGDLLFYLSKSDSWSGEQELLKLGRIRVKMDPALVADGAVFKQELDLKTGTILINSQPATRNSLFGSMPIRMS